jgi:hypothetical protein
MHLSFKRKATNILGALLKRAIKIEKIALYYSKCKLCSMKKCISDLIVNIALKTIYIYKKRWVNSAP